MSGENQKERIKFLMLEGKGNDEILTLTHQPMGVITRTRGWFNSPYGKVWQQNVLSKREEELKKQQGPPQPERAVAQPPAAPEPQRRQPPTLGELGRDGGLNGGNGAGPSVLSNGLEQELLLAGAPLIRKVVLNPKVFLWYDYAKTKMQFKGDIGDFVFDCVEDFFIQRGYSIVIERKETTQVT